MGLCSKNVSTHLRDRLVREHTVPLRLDSVTLILIARYFTLTFYEAESKNENGCIPQPPGVSRVTYVEWPQADTPALTGEQRRFHWSPCAWPRRWLGGTR